MDSQLHFHNGHEIIYIGVSPTSFPPLSNQNSWNFSQKNFLSNRNRAILILVLGRNGLLFFYAHRVTFRYSIIKQLQPNVIANLTMLVNRCNLDSAGKFLLHHRELFLAQIQRFLLINMILLLASAISLAREPDPCQQQYFPGGRAHADCIPLVVVSCAVLMDDSTSQDWCILESPFYVCRLLVQLKDQP